MALLFGFAGIKKIQTSFMWGPCAGKLSCRKGEDQSGGYQREHLNNAIVKFGREHLIFMGIPCPKVNDQDETNLAILVEFMVS